VRSTGDRSRERPDRRWLTVAALRTRSLIDPHSAEFNVLLGQWRAARSASAAVAGSLLLLE
jgi:hypothetical protein